MCVRGVKDWPETKVQWSRKGIAAYYTAASLWAWGWHHIARCVRCLTGTQPVVSANPSHRTQNTETKERIYLTSNETRFICFSFPFSEITLLYDLLNITLQITTSISFTSYLLSHILKFIWIPVFNSSHTSMNQLYCQYLCPWTGPPVTRGAWFWRWITLIHDIGVNTGLNRTVSGSLTVSGGVWSDGGVTLVVWGPLMVVVETYDLSDYLPLPTANTAL